MKSIYQYITGSISLMVTLLVTISCSSEYDYKADYASYKNVKLKVELVDDNNTLHLKMANETHQVTVSTDPEDVLIDLQAYIYKIADESMATIDQSGILTMKKVGTTELLVAFRGSQEVATSCKVSITRDPVKISNVKVPLQAKVQEHKTLELAPLIVIIPGTADNQVLLYESLDPTVATIDSEGIVTGIKEGSTTIKVSTTDGSDITRDILLEVLGEIKVNEIKLNAVAKLNEKTVPIGQVFNIGSAITVMPTNASNKEVVYSLVSGEGVVSIDKKGVLKTLAAGEAKIKIAATDESGIEVELSLKVDATIQFLEHSLWILDTSIRYYNNQNYVTDGATGMTEHMFDGVTTTFLSLVKPGKSYGSYKADPLDKPLYFTVDMGSINKFNFFKWGHRSNNSFPYLRTWGIHLYGSNDGQNFTMIKTDIDIPYSSNTTIFEIDVPESEYRYIKVQFSKWSDIAGGDKSGSALQIAEFNIGNH